MKRTYIKDLKDNIGKEVTIAGWVNGRRDHGKLIFLDLRDATGTVQMVSLPSNSTAHNIANEIRSEWVVLINGLVNKRPERMINANETNGDIEIEIRSIEVLNKSEIPLSRLKNSQDAKKYKAKK